MRTLAAFMAAMVLGAAGAQTWQDLGPAPISNGSYTGRISAIAASPGDPNRYFVAGADGGVWRTTDGGQTWTPLTDRMPTSAMGALAIDPSDPNVIYAGTGEGNHANHSRYGLGLLKSQDGGATWQQLAESVFAGRCFTALVVDPSNRQRLYAGITNAGGFPEKAAARLHPLRNGPVGVFRSTDGGSTWSQLTTGIPNQACTDLAIDPTNPNIVYAAIGRIFGSPDNGIYKSTNGGDSWTKLAGGLPTASVGRISIGLAPSRPSRLYALIARQCDASGGGASTLGGYRTDDGGTTWTSIGVGSIQATYGWYLSTVSIQPTNPDVVIMGGLELVRSTNAGSSFSTVTPPHVDMHALAWDAQGRLLCGNDGGVHVSSSLGSSWTSLNAGLGVIQFYAGLSLHPTDRNILLGGTQDNGSNRRATNSRSWTQVLGGDGGWTQIDQANPSRAFAEYQGSGGLFRSTNGGSSFSGSGSGINTGDRNCFLPSYEIDPTNSNRMLYGTHRVYESTNGGTSWTAVSGDVTNGSGAIRSLAIAPSNPNVTYVATNDGIVAVSRDRGRTFTRILTGMPGWPRVTREVFVDPRTDQTLYLAVSAYGVDQVRRTRDGGNTWESLDGNLPDLPVNTIAADVRGSRPVIYIGTDQGVYWSNTEGATWQPYGIGLPTSAVIDIRLDVPKDRIVVATQGRGAWSAPIRPPLVRTTPR